MKFMPRGKEKQNKDRWIDRWIIAWLNFCFNVGGKHIMLLYTYKGMKKNVERFPQTITFGEETGGERRNY